jgi:membrane protein
MQLRNIWGLLKETGNSWDEDKVMRMSAALAYYTVLSAAPLLVIAIGIAGLVFGKNAAEGQLVEQFRDLVGEDGAQAIQTMIAHASGPGTSTVAMIVGIVLLLFGASGVFVELQDSLNTIWEVVPRPGRPFLTILRERFISFAMVLVTGFLLLVSLSLSAALAAMTAWLGLAGIGMVGQVLTFAISFVVITLLFALIYKILPDVDLAWRDVWFGAIVTSLLFSIGKLLIGLYLGRAGVGSAYGAAGSLVVFVVWVYYSAQIVLLGAEFTKVYMRQSGARIKPSSNAVPITHEALAQQGAPPTQELERAAGR